MKALIVVILCGAAVFGVVKVLGSTLSPAEYSGDRTAVRGDLEVGNLCRCRRAVTVWREPRPTHTRKDREYMRLGTLNVGDRFVVLKHVQKGAPLWVQIRCEDRDLEGWVISEPHDPLEAEKIRGP